MTVEDEATQTDWMGDLYGGLGFDPAAGRGRCSPAPGRAGLGHRTVDGRTRAGLGRSAEVRAAVGGDVERYARERNYVIKAATKRRVSETRFELDYGGKTYTLAIEVEPFEDTASETRRRE